MAETTVNEDLVYVPDRLFCPNCRGVVTGERMDGNARCPGDETKLVRLTWKQEADMLGRRLRHALEDRWELSEKLTAFMAEQPGFCRN